MSQDLGEGNVDVEDLASEVAMASPETGALDLLRAGTVSEMCEAIASFVRETFAVKAVDVSMNDVRDIAVLCVEMTAVDITATDSPVRFAEVVLRMGLTT